MVASEDHPFYAELEAAILAVHQSLAKEIVLDGEGATKFVTVDVRGAKNSAEAAEVAYMVAQSPLVKTALFASDPNWGRIVMAVGNANVPEFDATLVEVKLDDVLIVEHGGRAASYTEEAGQQVMDRDNFTINIDLGRGHSQSFVWTSDLSHEYVTINAEYRS